MPSILDGDYFEAEDGIKALLAAEFGDEIRNIASPASLAELKEQSQGPLNLYVVYAGDVNVDASSDGDDAEKDQQWLVVLSVRNAAAQLDSSKSRAVAGPYVSRMLKCLLGQQPSLYTGPLISGAGQVPGYSPAFAYFPFLFRTRIVI